MMGSKKGDASLARRDTQAAARRVADKQALLNMLPERGLQYVRRRLGLALRDRRSSLIEYGSPDPGPFDGGAATITIGVERDEVTHPQAIMLGIEQTASDQTLVRGRACPGYEKDLAALWSSMGFKGAAPARPPARPAPLLTMPASPQGPSQYDAFDEDLTAALRAIEHFAEKAGMSMMDVTLDPVFGADDMHYAVKGANGQELGDLYLKPGQLVAYDTYRNARQPQVTPAARIAPSLHPALADCHPDTRKRRLTVQRLKRRHLTNAEIKLKAKATSVDVIKKDVSWLRARGLLP